MEPKSARPPPPHNRIRLMARLRYGLDNTLSRGPAGLIVWLAGITVMLVLGMTAFIRLAGNDPDKDFGYILWNILYQTITPNPVDPRIGSNTFLFTMLFSTVSSLLLVSILIGILTNAIDNRIQNLRKGRSFVIEHNHIVILGWSSKIYGIISELITANLHQKKPRLVILADRDKVAMEDDIRARVGRTHNTRVICRSGSPMDLADLDVVNPQASRSIIILSPEDDEPDSQVIKTILALTNHPDRRAQSYHVVAEIREPKHMEIAHIVGSYETKLVLASDLISRITVQASRQSGLSVIYNMLLDFSNDGIFFVSEPSLVGKTYADALFAYEDSAVLGLLHSDRDVVLNPPMTTGIAADDTLIVLSRSDNTIRLSKPDNLEINADCEVRRHLPVNQPERTLILGWNAHTIQMIYELDKYVAAGSQALVVCDNPECDVLATVTTEAVPMVPGAAGSTGIPMGYRAMQHVNLTVAYQKGDITERAVLEALNIQDYDHVIILSPGNAGATSIQKADALTLVTLLHLRTIAEQCGHKFNIVTEMMDVRNRRLAEVTRADDFIVSDRLTGLILAQVSENAHLMDVFSNLFDAETASIYLKPATHYVTAGRPVNFYTVVESAARYGDTALGYRLSTFAGDSSKSYGVVLNPHKASLITFSGSDRIIVLHG